MGDDNPVGRKGAQLAQQPDQARRPGARPAVDQARRAAPYQIDSRHAVDIFHADVYQRRVRVDLSRLPVCGHGRLR
jgi:hypothetical protein